MIPPLPKTSPEQERLEFLKSHVDMEQVYKMAEKLNKDLDRLFRKVKRIDKIQMKGGKKK